MTQITHNEKVLPFSGLLLPARPGLDLGSFQLCLSWAQQTSLGLVHHLTLEHRGRGGRSRCPRCPDAHDSAHRREIKGNQWSRHVPKSTHQPPPLPLGPGTPLTPPTRPRAPPSPPPSRFPRNHPPSPHRPRRHPRWR